MLREWEENAKQYRIRLKEEIEQDFFSNVNKESSHTYNGTPCWEWTENLTKAGCGTYGGMVAYRFLWTQILGREQPKGMELHHRCEFRPCVNPWHLELLTRKEHRASP